MGFSTDRANYYGRITSETIADSDKRSQGIEYTNKAGEPINPAEKAMAALDMRTHEPSRALIKFVLDSGRTQYAWIYLDEFAGGTMLWSDVDWDEVIEHLDTQYTINPPQDEQPPEPEEEPQPIDESLPDDKGEAPKPLPLTKRIGKFFRRLFSGR